MAHVTALRILAAASVAALLAYGGGYLQGRIEGRAAERIAQERANERAAAKSEDARARVDACYDAGGVWLRDRGRCVQDLP
ncbi:MAG: hypothetical protein EA385_14085 [Salinarimonadaceae bacterium]|nr:MAG: hypothetical protein EA385_14085 [Salinarimonadaceae bacterium]